ncbi:putative protein kinase RLK-Pelle-DLSV family [Rosa chinensis]|uniref:Protein kinase domain-containing protein n=1 Tax=Rosa chinensis TaxID=74649 RepID=A0A2P6P5R6_ROSCH|nr:putative protein kinase RLK-Pelle-DLSV family [Rosa chinensis]
MRFPIPKLHCSTWVFLIIFVFFFSTSKSDPRISEAGQFCRNSTHTSDSNFIPNFIDAMESISNSVNEKQWGEYSITSPAPKLYAFAQCHSDLSPKDCSTCFAISRTKLPKCLPSTSARIYLDGCFLAYDDLDFSGQALDEDHKNVKCGSPVDFSKDNYMKEGYNLKVRDVIGNLTKKAEGNEGFALVRQRGGVESVYALAQCWRTISDKGCRDCLEEAGKILRGCLPGKQGRAMLAGCYMRYSTARFYDIEEEEEANGNADLWHVLAVIIAGMVISVLSLFGFIMAYRKLQKMTGVDKYSIGTSTSPHKNSLNFKYEMLEKATDYFNASRKLGQGGAGSVFKGTLPDGSNVAVKRLFFNTRQWAFGLQQCSIEGPESLLVYEYVPTKSLNQILFGRGTEQVLSWQQRFNIISGIAEGLVYLHESYSEKIIHRDRKSSNILLDEDLTPKIADFGLARCVGPDKSHLSTGIAGTLGYMAPEYLVRGQLTDKADVYAFGVLVLEIVCGRKNHVFIEGSHSVLYSVYKHYRANTITESVDAMLKGEYSKREASNVLQIGLLCTQASLALRPSMSEVVHMLTDKM